MSRLDRILAEAFEQDTREREEAEARVEAQRDPFKQKRDEPGRARYHKRNGASDAFGLTARLRTMSGGRVA